MLGKESRESILRTNHINTQNIATVLAVMK